jgi:hypothetical protein
MLTENNVVEAVVLYLEEQDYTIHRKRTTSQRGIDIEATRSDGIWYFVEAKGATSSREGSNRYGQEFDNNQIKSHVGVALLKTFQTLQSFPESKVAIALPDNDNHRQVIDSISTPISNLGVIVLLVDNEKNVNKYIPKAHS